MQKQSLFLTSGSGWHSSILQTGCILQFTISILLPITILVFTNGYSSLLIDISAYTRIQPSLNYRKYEFLYSEKLIFVMTKISCLPHILPLLDTKVDRLCSRGPICCFWMLKHFLYSSSKRLLQFNLLLTSVGSKN